MRSKISRCTTSLRASRWARQVWQEAASQLSKWATKYFENTSDVRARSQGGRRLHKGLGGNPVRHHEHRGQLKAGGRLDARSCHSLIWHRNLSNWPGTCVDRLCGEVFCSVTSSAAGSNSSSHCPVYSYIRPFTLRSVQTTPPSHIQGVPKKGTFRMIPEPRCKRSISSNWHPSQSDLNKPLSGKKILVSFLSRIKRFQAMSMGKFGQATPNFGLDFSALAAFWKSILGHHVLSFVSRNELDLFSLQASLWQRWGWRWLAGKGALVQKQMCFVENSNRF